MPMITDSKLILFIMIFIRLLTQSLMRNFYPNYGMPASLLTSGVSSKPIYPTDNN